MYPAPLTKKRLSAHGFKSFKVSIAEGDKSAMNPQEAE